MTDAMRSRPLQALGLFLVLVASTAFAQPQHGEELERAVGQLSSDDWKTRQQATQSLVQLGDEAIGRLEHLAATAADDEVRTRAAAAVAQIEENRVTGTSLITLNLRDVPAGQAVAELARQARAT